jgi:1-pyrroline-5-carboxylate dehydrogenase
MDAVTQVPPPRNEPVKTYAPDSPERASLERRLVALSAEQADLTLTVGGVQRQGGGEPIPVVMPHDHQHVLGVMHNATEQDAEDAIKAAHDAAADWREMSIDDRAAIFCKAADLAAGPWRDTLNAATMLGQSKTIQQAEIDAACELIDFLRFNVHYARRIYAEQPISSPGVWNRVEYRPLEGFVYAVTPFNFTAIAGNLPTAPALMGNVVLWKPSPTQTLAAHHTMRMLEAAGLPPGVINLLTGDGLAVSNVALRHPELAGIHFTGSTRTFRRLWRGVAEGLDGFHNYPRIVGETGGKDFIVAHASADPAVLRTALVRGAFEYQGQKCSAASRAYIPRSLWERYGDEIIDETESLEVGDVADLSHFMGGVIDARAYAKHAAALERARASGSVTVVAGGTCDDSTGYFVRPTLLRSDDPTDEIFTTEYFGPILGIYVYDDNAYAEVLRQVDSAAAYGLTGAVIAQDRAAITTAAEKLRYAAGNFYVNDKPTGAVVGQQPFGGARASGTNDKAGSMWNLVRWVSPRTLKETFVPPTDYRYPHMG